ncbi:MAG TPA: TonB-dependent receptor [Bryobacteraceae bacterium]|nr:TonB-dependent receptor [Bryobacteraceae bacterium]
MTGFEWLLKNTAALMVTVCIANCGPLTVTVRDPQSRPAAGVDIQILRPLETATGKTDAGGSATFDLPPGHYSVTAIQAGFEPSRAEVDVIEAAPSAVELLLVPAKQHQDIDVQDTVSPISQNASTPATIAPEVGKELPSRPATVSDLLPLIPGVARSPQGGLQISGSGEHRSALIVNSADVTDPATGQFGLTVPVDVVESLNVYQTPFLAQYGQFTAGLVSVETRRGGDKWKIDLNDPFPDFFIRSYHMHGVKDATPRLNFGGPVIARKLYFTEGIEYEMRKTEAYTLPWPVNQQKQEGINSFSQLDWIVSGRQLVTASLHIAPRKTDFANINFLNPEPVSPSASTNNYTGTVSDRFSFGGGLLESTLSTTRFDATVWPQGPLAETIAPWGNSGNYFENQNRIASRVGWSSIYSFASLNFLGTHNFKVGSYLAGSWDQGQVEEKPINLVNGAGQLIEQIAFSGGRPYDMVDTQYSFFGQDHWIVSPKLAFDLGLRTESQEVSESFRVAPRVGIAWTPLPSSGTVFRAGFGIFYDRVPLNVYAFANYPQAAITTFDGFGKITSGPYLFQNIIGEMTAPYPLVWDHPAAGNFSPRSATWRAEVEQRITPDWKLRAGYMENDGAGLVVLNKAAPAPGSTVGAYELTGSGRSRYRQFEVTASWRLKETSTLFFSYVHSQALGDLNDFSSFLGTFPAPLLRPDQYGTLPTDLPNRLLAWGAMQLPRGWRISPVVELRNGFPYAVTDALQNYFGVPYQNRFPTFFSADARVSKDIKVSPKYTLRFSVSGFNLTDNFNPEGLHTNIADPAFGAYLGQHGRRYTADFDVIF